MRKNKSKLTLAVLLILIKIILFINKILIVVKITNIYKYIFGYFKNYIITLNREKIQVRLHLIQLYDRNYFNEKFDSKLTIFV